MNDTNNPFEYCKTLEEMDRMLKYLDWRANMEYHVMRITYLNNLKPKKTSFLEKIFSFFK